MTVCGDTSLSDGLYFAGSGNLINIHTSRIVGYPSSILFHNYGSTNAVYSFNVADARTGLFIGSQRVSVLANTSYVIPMSWFEDNLGWVPNSNQQHANIVVFPDLSSVTANPYRAVTGQIIYNASLQAYINMTQICHVSH